MHAAPAHTGVAFVGVGHALPHVPQLFGSLERLAQNVGEATGHAVWPSVQPHADDTHAIPELHVLPQVPQFAGSVAKSAQ